MGTVRGKLQYAELLSLIELELTAGRLREEADVLELARANRERPDDIRRHLAGIHRQYASRFEELLRELDQPASG
jgi:hypothetical protein